MIDDVYLIDAGQNLLFINTNSLQQRVISKNEFKTREFREIIPSICSNLPYTKWLTANTSYTDISPTIITSFDCNYFCKYCFQREKRRGDTYTAPNCRVDAIVPFLSQYAEQYDIKFDIGTIHISGGEPFLPSNQDLLWRIADTIPRKGMLITTNGTYVNNYYDFITSQNIQIKLSLDGIKEVHLSRRYTLEKTAYEKTWDNLKMLVSNNISVTVISVFSAENIEFYTAFFDALEELGWPNNPKLAFISEIGNGSDDFNFTSTMESLEAFLHLRSIDRRTKHVDARKLVPGCANLYDAIIQASTKSSFNPYRCACLYKPSYAFLPDGTVSFCAAADSKLGRVGKYWPNIEIDNESVLAAKNRRIDTVTKCNSCNKKVFCQGGCLATVLSKTGDISGLYCDIWKKDDYLKFVDLVMNW